MSAATPLLPDVPAEGTRLTDWSDLTPEEMAEIEAAYARADENYRSGRGIPVEKYFADRGISWPPAPTG